jgi:hypothetical protein
MNVSDDELRQLVRNSIARLHGGATSGGSAGAVAGPSASHDSHRLFPLSRGGDGDGACLIEPSVRCNHCGYCLSYGH